MEEASDKRSMLDRANALIALVGSAVTIGLTYANHNTKTEIDRADGELKQRAQQLEASIKDRETLVQESKANVERLKWVFDSLVPAMSAQKSPLLSEPDAKKRAAAATAMIRLALDQNQAQTLLAGLEQSTIPEVKNAAIQIRKDIISIDNNEARKLVDQMVGSNSDARRSALSQLRQSFPSSPSGIARALEQLAPQNVKTIENTGLVNLLYYLSRTESAAWTPDNVQTAQSVLPGLHNDKRGGTQWKAELDRLERVLAQAR